MFTVKQKEKKRKISNALHCTRNSRVFLFLHMELQYYSKLAEKGTWLFYSNEHLKQYREMITCGCSMAFHFFYSVVLMNE